MAAEAVQLGHRQHHMHHPDSDLAQVSTSSSCSAEADTVAAATTEANAEVDTEAETEFFSMGGG